MLFANHSALSPLFEKEKGFTLTVFILLLVSRNNENTTHNQVHLLFD
jgi:hypothetical protein